jgi:hypothetical protein
MGRKWRKPWLFRNRKLFRRFQNGCFITIVVGQVWVVGWIVIVKSLYDLSMKLLKSKNENYINHSPRSKRAFDRSSKVLAKGPARRGNLLRLLLRCSSQFRQLVIPRPRSIQVRRHAIVCSHKRGLYWIARVGQKGSSLCSFLEAFVKGFVQRLVDVGYMLHFVGNFAWVQRFVQLGTSAKASLVSRGALL